MRLTPDRLTVIANRLNSAVLARTLTDADADLRDALADRGEALAALAEAVKLLATEPTRREWEGRAVVFVKRWSP